MLYTSIKKQQHVDHPDNGDETSYTRESLMVILSDDSINNGLYLWDAGFGEYMKDIWISWPAETATDWTTFTATFKFNAVDNSPQCESCYAAFWLESNEGAYPLWDSDVSWSIRDLQLKRESSTVEWESPITSFESELVEIRRMEYLSDVEQNGWDRTGIYLYEHIYCV